MIFSHLNRQTSDAESGDLLSEGAENRVINDRKRKYSESSGLRSYDSRNLSAEENDDGEYEGMDRSDLVNSKTINDILKYGAHQSCDSYPVETQSEWSDEDERDDDEAKGKSTKKSSIFPPIKLCFCSERWSRKYGLHNR